MLLSYYSYDANVELDIPSCHILRVVGTKTMKNEYNEFAKFPELDLACEREIFFKLDRIGPIIETW